jgi:hypothetical protein
MLVIHCEMGNEYKFSALTAHSGELVRILSNPLRLTHGLPPGATRLAPPMQPEPAKVPSQAPYYPSLCLVPFDTQEPQLVDAPCTVELPPIAPSHVPIPAAEQYNARHRSMPVGSRCNAWRITTAGHTHNGSQGAPEYGLEARVMPPNSLAL